MRVQNRSKKQVVTVVAAVLLVAGMASATTLQDLIQPGATITSGDKLFSNFAAMATGFGNRSLDLSVIEVVPIAVGPDYGLLFRNTTPGSPIMWAAGDSFADLLLAFDVTATRDGWLLKDIALEFSGDAPTDGLAQVVETALAGPKIVGQISVQLQGGPTSAHLDFAQADYAKTLHISKDIAVVGGVGPNGGTAKIDWFSQTFSQVPEPATLGLLGFGAVLLLAPRRSRALLKAMAPAVLVVAAVAGTLASAGGVFALPMTDLLNGGTVVSGDKVFSNFTWNVVGTGRYIAEPTAVDISPIALNGEEGFRMSGLLAALSNAIPNSSAVVTLGYDVTVTDPLWRIKDISLSFNGIATAPDGFAMVDEIVVSGMNVVGMAHVQTPAPLSDHKDLAQPWNYTTLHVEKVITLFGGANSGFTTISFINQTFSQIEIPEPAMLGLLALGTPFVLPRRRRH